MTGANIARKKKKATDRKGKAIIHNEKNKNKRV